MMNRPIVNTDSNSKSTDISFKNNLNVKEPDKCCIESNIMKDFGRYSYVRVLRKMKSGGFH